MRLLELGALLCVSGACLLAQGLNPLEGQTSEFTLSNGLHCILVERHDAPLVSFHTYVKAGTADDPPGKTGLAYLLSRVMVKGTETLGTRSWENESRALSAAEQALARFQAERDKGRAADPDKLSTLEAEWTVAEQSAGTWADSSAYYRLLADNGATGFSVRALPDSTEYSYTLPSDKTELWFLLESQRLAHPVFREFYKERRLIADEYRTQVENRAASRVEEALLATAFAAHPYRNPAYGWPEDLANLTVADAQDFFNKYYGPENIVIAIVGDIQHIGLGLVANKYFAPIAARPAPPRRRTAEPPQLGPKSASVGASGPGLVALGYKRPNDHSPDDPALGIIQAILSGRSGPLQTELIDKGLAQNALARAVFPAGHDPNLFFFLLSPAPGHTLEEVEKALDGVIAPLQNRPVTQDALARAKAQIRAGALRRLADNSSLAELLASYYANFGDWRRLLRMADATDKVTADAVRQAAQRYFTPANLTVASLSPGGRGGAAGASTGGRP